MMEQYILQPSEMVEDGLVLTDTFTGIVLRFIRGSFNESQVITKLEDSDVSAMDMAIVVREMGEWLAQNHPDLLFGTEPLYYIAKSSGSVFTVWRKGDGTLLVKRDGKPFRDAGKFIMSMGGVETLLSKCCTKNELERQLEEKRAQKERKRLESAILHREEAENSLATLSQLQAASQDGVIETTPANLRIVAKYMRFNNPYTLPSMSIGYSADTYDCDGKIAVAFRLDAPIDIDGESVSKIAFFAPMGHLTNYYKLK